MIVQPDFPDHWKTQALVSLSGDECAIRCLLRFWAHCQSRRRWKFKDLDAKTLALMCKWPHDADRFFSAMLETFLEKNDGMFVAHQWKDMNASLITAWNRGKYGKLGGRPKRETLDKPSRLVGVTLDKPSSNPIREEKRRVDKIREEEEIYAAYPLKRGKPDALRAIKNAIKRTGIDPHQLLILTHAYATARNGDLSYVPNPATWFNQDRFRDEPSTWVRSQNGVSEKPKQKFEII
jgi:hypothetical protein